MIMQALFVKLQDYIQIWGKTENQTFIDDTLRPISL